MYTKPSALHVCQRPPALSRVVLMRGARAPASEYNNHFNSKYWLLRLMGFYLLDFYRALAWCDVPYEKEFVKCVYLTIRSCFPVLRS